MSDGSLQRNIRAATLLWMASVLLSRVMGFAREIIIARVAGANADTDVYFTAFTIPDFLNYLLAGGALSITFIPIFAGYLAENREEEGWKAFSIITSFLGVSLGIGIAIAMIFMDRLSPLVADGFTPDQLAQLTHFTRIVLPAQFFLFQGFLLSAVQMARGQHSYPALLPLFYNGFTILGGVILGPILGMEGFCWGILAGAIVGGFLLQLYGARKVGLRWWPCLELRHDGFIRYFKLSLPIMLGQSLVMWDEWITRYFGSFLTAASISWLNYGRKLAMVPQAVFGQAAGTASYPFLARLAAEKKVQELFDTLTTSLREVLALALSSSVFVMVLAWDICFLLFRSGRFSDQDVNATAPVLMLFSLGVAAWSVQGFIARGYYALKDTITPTLLGTLMTLLSIPVYAVASRTGQHLGLALGSTVAITLYAVVLYGAFLRKLRRLEPGLVFRPLLPFLARLGLGCAVAGGLSYGLRALLWQVSGPGSGLVTSVGGLLGEGPRSLLLATWLLTVARGAVVAGIGGPLLIVLCLLLGVDELRSLVQKILRRLPSGRRLGPLVERLGKARG